MKPTIYVPPRPIQINTADIDVSASKFDRNRNVRVRSTSPEPTKAHETEQSSAVAGSSDDASAYMPRVDQNDPPHFRSTIKRDRHIVRLSTMRRRSKSRSIEKRSSSKKSRSSRKSLSSKKSISDDQPELEATKDFGGADEQNIKKSWRDKFGDSLQMNTQKVARKTPGELILEKHIIRDKKNEENLSTNLPKTVIRVPESVTPQEITYLEPMIRKSMRRQSLIKCPSFKDICNDISSDLKADDDLNAGELRRRASLIHEQEDQILAHLATVTRRPSADLVNVDVPILEVEEPLSPELQNESKSKDSEKPQVENVIVIKKKTKKKGGKIRHKITVSVDVDSPVEPALTLSTNCETTVSTEKTSPKWKAVVEDIEEDHTIHKVFKLPKKRQNGGNHQLKKSESGEDFWKQIDRRESIHYKRRIDSKHHEIDILEIIEQDPSAENTPVEESVPVVEPVSIEKSELKEEPVRVERVEEKPEVVAKIEIIEVAPDEAPIVVSKERRRSSFAVKSRSTNDIDEMKEQKKKLNSDKPKLKTTKKSDASPTVSSGDKKQAKPKVRRQSSSDVGDTAATPAKSKLIETNTKSKVSSDKISNIISNGDSSEKTPSKDSVDKSKIDGATAKGKAKAAIVKSSPKIAKETKRTSSTDLQPVSVENETNNAAHEKVIKPKVGDNSTISPSAGANAEKPLTNGSAMANAAEPKAIDAETKPKKLKKAVSTPKASASEKTATSAQSSENENRKIVGSDADASKCTTTADAESSSSITIETVQHDVRDKDAKSIAADADAVDANNNNLKTNSASVAVGAPLSKFATVSNLNSSDLSAPVTCIARSNAADDDYISGEETFDLLLSSDTDDNSADDWEACSDTESGNEMGLKRRHRKKKDKFDPKKVIKLDHKRKCYVVDEAPKYPLIATPRPLQKKYKFYSESETESEGSDSDCVSSDGCYDDCLSPSDVLVKDVIRMSTCSNDSGFEGGGTAPSSPKKMLGKHDRANNNLILISIRNASHLSMAAPHASHFSLSIFDDVLKARGNVRTPINHLSFGGR